MSIYINGSAPARRFRLSNLSMEIAHVLYVNIHPSIQSFGRIELGFTHCTETDDEYAQYSRDIGFCSWRQFSSTIWAHSHEHLCDVAPLSESAF